jgi:hypothetical protein
MVTHAPVSAGMRLPPQQMRNTPATDVKHLLSSGSGGASLTFRHDKTRLSEMAASNTKTNEPH